MWRFLIFLPLCSVYADVLALYLSWYSDPTSTMTIQWHTPFGEHEHTIDLQSLEGNWETVDSQHTDVEETVIHQVSLENLNPNTEYAFRIGNDPKVYRFRTAPANLEEPLRFVIGGDVYSNKKCFKQMSQTVLKHDPHFAVLGGDIAYARPYHPFQSSGLRRWTSFLKDWKEIMITPEGRIIPFLIVPGNHDIAPDDYELFFSLFAFPKKQLYRTVDFGSYLTLFLLDTGHFHPIEGQQTLWLEKTLSAHTPVPYTFAVYHEAAYPSFYPYQATTPKKIRKNWVPLFEKYHLLAAFEHHNHAFKRTHPIKDNQIDPEGVVYIGDGAWGVHPRKTNDLWYLAKRGRKNNALIVELTSTEATITALDLLDSPLDEMTLTPLVIQEADFRRD